VSCRRATLRPRQADLELLGALRTDRRAVHRDELITGEDVESGRRRAGGDAGDDRRATDEHERNRHGMELPRPKLFFLRRVEPHGRNHVRVRIRGPHHPLDRRHEQVMRVDRIRVIHADLVEDLREHLEVFVRRSGAYGTFRRILRTRDVGRDGQRDQRATDHEPHAVPPRQATHGLCGTPAENLGNLAKPRPRELALRVFLACQCQECRVRRLGALAIEELLVYRPSVT
jgi:hypothetical protein